MPQNYTGAEVQRAPETEVKKEQQNNMKIPPLPADANFEGRTVLVMDDDIRNIFAINSILESRKMRVLHAENGKIGIRILKENPDVDLVLMDTMMPEMNGLTATQEIRKIDRFKHLPIISLTAKAMKGDRENALNAGSSDYVTKPVEPDQLLSIIHTWIGNAPSTHVEQ